MSNAEKEKFEKLKHAVELALDHIIKKGCDDIFKPPVFSASIEHDIITNNEAEFRSLAYKNTIDFVKTANLEKHNIGHVRNTLIVKDANSFRQVGWMDPFDAIKYLTACILLLDEIENARIPREDGFIHSHRKSKNKGELFDSNYGYDSFRAKSGSLSRDKIGHWKVVTDISNFFDRIGNHSLENHLLDVGCDKEKVTLLREMLYFWAGDRRSFGVPVGSDASRIISEAALIDVDKKLRETGIQFVRYVDDYRLFAKTRAKAYKALETLTTLLADEGLTINSKKTSIYEILREDEVNMPAVERTDAEHEKIDTTERIEIKVKKLVSGKAGYSKYYKEPGKEALAKIISLKKDDLIKNLRDSSPGQQEDNVKLVTKYFIYAESDTTLITELINKSTTTIFYICDALIKEADKLTKEKREETVELILNSLEWDEFAYPYQVPLLRLVSSEHYAKPELIRKIFDNHKYKDNNIFFREAILLASSGLDRARVRQLSLTIYPGMPDFVRRSIYKAVKDHPGLSEDEKRPLLKNMKQSSTDWFIKKM